MEENIPSSGKVIKITSAKLDISIEQEELGTLSDNEALIKVHSFPAMQYDRVRLSSPFTKYPIVPSMECSGTIVDYKGNLDKSTLLGKKVTVWSTCGCAREYIIENMKNIFIGNDTDNLSELSTRIINPLTAFGLVEMARNKKSKAIIQTAANSTTGKIIARLCEYYGIAIINIVRSEQRLQEMHQLGFNNLLDMTDKDFPQKLNELATQLEADVALDCLSGDIVGTLVKVLPFGGFYYNYGTLSKQPLGGVDTADFRWRMKEIKPFVVAYWVEKKSNIEKEEVVKFVMNNSELFKQEIAKIFKADEASEALAYFEQNQGARVLITFE